MNKNKSFATLDDADLVERIDESRAELFNLRFQFATGQLDDSSAVQKGTKKVARLLTELRSREIAAAEALERQEL
ncbi:MAG: 50S ribosomal protein L29 [Acidimicrobiaceae bacterium]|nr:50S ribosomal protein L29 [Acidimicrobiaceae bacterium]